MTDDEFMEFVEKTARPELTRHLRFSSNFTLPREDVEDIVQDTLIRFLAFRPSLPESPMAWLKTTAKNIQIDRWRKTAGVESVPLDDKHAEIEQEVHPDNYEILDLAVEKLKPQENRVIEMLLSGSTQAEIAKELNVPATTIAHWIRMAKRTLSRDTDLIEDRMDDEMMVLFHKIKLEIESGELLSTDNPHFESDRHDHELPSEAVERIRREAIAKAKNRRLARGE